MDPLWSETCWSTFKYFIILIVSTYYILCITWIIKYLIIIDGWCIHEDNSRIYSFFYAYVARLGDSHTGVDQNSRLPRCCVLSLINSNRRFGGPQCILFQDKAVFTALPPSPLFDRLPIEIGALGMSGMLVTIYHSTRRNIPDDLNPRGYFLYSCSKLYWFQRCSALFTLYSFRLHSATVQIWPLQHKFITICRGILPVLGDFALP